jgi:uncharacterized MAPEG superfamily protein
MERPHSAAELRASRTRIVLSIAATMPLAFLLWLALRFIMPPLAGLEEPLARLEFAFGCIAAAVLLALLPGVEAVAHERLVSPAIDPLAGYETRRLRINQRYLQNTLEQTAVFAAGLIPLALYVPDGGGMRAVVATTVVWIVARWAFWIGYLRSPLLRGIGAAGMVQSMIVLGYVVFRFGYSLAGWPGGLAPILLFVAIEIWLFAATARPSPPIDPAPPAIRR